MGTLARVFTGFLLGVLTCSLLFAFSTGMVSTRASWATPTPFSRVTSTVMPAPPVMASTEMPTEMSTPTAMPGPEILPFGQPVVVGNFEYRVSGALDKGNFLKSNNKFEEDRTTAGKYIEVVFDARNLGADSNAFERTGGIVDSKGRKFDEIDASGLFVADEHYCSWSDPIQPTFSRTCSVIFEVAADSDGFYIVFVDQELMGTDEARVWLGG